MSNTMQHRLAAMVMMLTLISMNISCNNGSSGSTGDTDGCQVHEDCEGQARPYCFNSICVQCIEDTNCSCHQTCNSQKECQYLDDRGYPDKYTEETIICQPDEFCEDGVNCCEAGTFCNIFTGRCLRGADYNTNCDDTNPCSLGLVCDVFHNICVPQPTCNTGYNCCVVPLNDDVTLPSMQCSQAGRCDTYTLECTPPESPTSACPYEPKDSTECPNGKFCISPGICVQCACDDDCPTSSDLSCDLSSGLCKSADACTSSADCPSLDEECDPSTGQCVAHCDEDDECTWNEYCNLELNVCRPESTRPCSADQYEGYEGNDTIATAYNLPPDTTSINTATKCPSDIDWYQLPLEKGDLVRIAISLEAGNGDDTMYLDFILSDGTTVYKSTDTGWFSTIIEFTANYSDYFYLKVYGKEDLDQASYSVYISYGQGDVCSDIYEEEGAPNDLPHLATDLEQTYGSCVSYDLLGSGKRITCDQRDLAICIGDRDYYRISVPDTNLIRATLSGYDGNLNMRLFGPVPDGSSFSSEFQIATSLYQDPQEEIEWYARPGGTFYISIEPQGLNQTNYNLTIENIDSNSQYGCSEDSFDYDSSFTFNDTFLFTPGSSTIPGSADAIRDNQYASDIIAANIPNSGLSASVDKTITNLNLCPGDQDSYQIVVDTEPFDGMSLIALPSGYQVQASLQSVVPADEWVALVLYTIINDEYVILDGDLSLSTPSQTVTTNISTGTPLFLSVFREVTENIISYELATTITPPPTCNVDDFEQIQNNNTPTYATILPLVSDSWDGSTNGYGQYGNLVTTQQEVSLCVNDFDWYRLVPPDNVFITIELEYNDKNLDPFVALYSDQVLDSSNFSNPSTWEGLRVSSQYTALGYHQLRYQRPLSDVSSNYFLIVYDHDGWPITDYRLRISYSSIQCQEDLYDLNEGNDSYTDPTPLTLAQDAQQVLHHTSLETGLTMCNPSPESDYYSVYLSRGDIISSTIFYNPTEGNLDLYLRKPVVTPEAGQPTSVAHSFDEGSSIGILEINYVVPDDGSIGDYLLHVVPYSNYANASFSNLYTMYTEINRLCLIDPIGAPLPPLLASENGGTVSTGELTYVVDDFLTYPPTYDDVDGSELYGLSPLGFPYNASLCNNDDWMAVTLPSGHHGLTVCTEFMHSQGDIDVYFYGNKNVNGFTVPDSDPTAPGSFGGEAIYVSRTKNNYEVIRVPPSESVGTYFILIALDPRDLGNNLRYRLSIHGSENFTCPAP